MNLSRFYLCAIPQVVWQEPANAYRINIARFATDALGCERRIAKEVNLENEFSRYTLTCQRMEQEIASSGRIKQANDWQGFQQALQAGYFPAQALHPGYLALLSRIPEGIGPERLGASFFPPDRVGTHRAAFATWATAEGLANTPIVRQRLDFLQMVEQASCGLVELQTAFQPANEQQLQSAADYRPATPADGEKHIEIPEFESTGLAVEFFGQKGRKQALAQILRGQIQEALQRGEPVTFGNQAPHDVITEVLHEFVFVAQPAAQPVMLRVAYSDGSEAAPFPLFCLPRIKSERDQEVPALRVALMSMRHMEMDPEIDFCWFRNREVSRTRTLAETDDFCFDVTLNQLRDSLQLGPLALHVYHTGFEPAVIGFYRAVVCKLLELTRLSVSPFYYRGDDNYQEGIVWR